MWKRVLVWRLDMKTGKLGTDCENLFPLERSAWGGPEATKIELSQTLNARPHYTLWMPSCGGFLCHEMHMIERTGSWLLAKIAMQEYHELWAIFLGLNCYLELTKLCTRSMLRLTLICSQLDEICFMMNIILTLASKVEVSKKCTTVIWRNSVNVTCLPPQQK